MSAESHHKISATHLARQAYLYVRQSTLRQVLENNRIDQGQYALRERALPSDGSPSSGGHDSDLGQSGADADRVGFQRLGGGVGTGRGRRGCSAHGGQPAGAQLFLDWHRLLEICALANTLILDEDASMTPAFQRRLLFGCRERCPGRVHVLKARLIGGQLAKGTSGRVGDAPARGLVYDAAGKVVLDPDQSIQTGGCTVLREFRPHGSATATCVAFESASCSFPVPASVPTKASRVGRLLHYRALNVLKTALCRGRLPMAVPAKKTLQGASLATAFLGTSGHPHP